MHLILPYATSPALDMPSALAGLQLPNLQALLQGLSLVDRAVEPETPSPLMPHERLLARALGWPEDGPWPWAAWQIAHAGRATDYSPSATVAQAWLTPCHWQVGMDQVLLLDPASLLLADEESQALMAAVQSLLHEDGLQLRWHDALHWHASGALLEHLPTASLDRVIGQNLRHWLLAGSPGSAARTLSRRSALSSIRVALALGSAGWSVAGRRPVPCSQKALTVGRRRASRASLTGWW